MEKYLEFAKRLAYEAGEIMRNYFDGEMKADYKGDDTIVTVADEEINQMVIDRVRESFPEHSVNGEEQSYGESNFVWACDPIDGTAMFARGVPVAVFSLALVVDGAPIVGVVYDPFMDKLYSAIKGEGAYKNDEKIIVNDVRIGDRREVSNFDYWPEAKLGLGVVLDAFNKASSYFISVGSVARAAMCVASGDFVMGIFAGTEGKNVDVAAAKIIIEEAGGKMTDIYGNEQRYDGDIKGAIYSNGVVHDEVVKIVKENMR